jgi:hypothetical protein
MGYMYDAIHNTVRHDGKDDDDDRRGVIKDGERLRVRMTAMDSTQRAIASNDHDDNVELIDRQEMQDWDKAQLSARWKGGLEPGDRVRIGDKLMVVTGRNPANGKVQLSDASTSAQDAATIKQEARDAYERDLQNAWRNKSAADAEPGDSCTINGAPGRWCLESGKMVCRPIKSSKEHEWAVAGPLSDAEGSA